RDRLAIVVDVSLQSAEHRATQQDIWLSISQADYKFLTAKKDASVTASYDRALGKAEPFQISAARDQIELFRDAGVRIDRVTACLAVFPQVPPSSAPLRHAI